MKLSRNYKALLTIFLTFVISACSSIDEIDTSKPEGQFQLAEEFEKNERYQEAIMKYTDLKNQHPYSRFATEAELRIANIHFKRDSFIEAKLSYQLFREYHPKHSKTDFIIFRIGLSSFNQLPTTVDRDFSEAKSAIAAFNQLIKYFPNSPYTKEARIKKTEVFKKLAEKEMYIANYYFQRKQYKSSLKRFENIMYKYPRVGLNSAALYGASISAFEVKENDLAKKYLNQLYSDYPKSSETNKIKSKVGKYGVH